MRLSRVFAVASLALAACGVLTAATQSADAPSSEAAGWWPQAIVIVVERRIPPEARARGPIGPQLRQLREAVTQRLTDPAVALRPRDHVFVFADGMTEPDFACLTRGEACGIAGSGARLLDWSRGAEAAVAFMTHMLRLPSGPRQGGDVRVVTHRGAEFLYTQYDGDIAKLDCAIRREITAPMTSTMSASVDPCPLEGRTVNMNETRALSRVEQSIGVQLSVALDSLGDRRVSGVKWMWALLQEKSYLQNETLEGIRREHGERRSARSDAVRDIFRAAHRLYPTSEPETWEWDAGAISVRQVQWQPSVAAQKELHDKSLLSLTVGRARTQPLDDSLRIQRSFVGGEWELAVDHFDVAAAIRAPAQASLLQGAFAISSAGLPAVKRGPLSAEQGRVRLADEGLDATYRQALTHPSPDGRSFAIDVDLLLSGGPDSRLPAFTPIPIAYRTQRTLSVAARVATSREIAIAASLGLLSLGAVVAIVRTLRPLPIDVTPAPRVLAWTLPLGEATTRELEIQGSSDHFHRRWFHARATVSLNWRLLVPTDMPMAGEEPFLLATIGGQPAPQGVDTELTTSWRPGSSESPRTLTTLVFRLDPARLDVSRLRLARPFNCRLELRVRLRARARLPLRPVSREFLVGADVLIQEVEPAPTIAFEVDSLYRRLGFATAEARSFATLRVANLAGEGAVPRPLRLSTRVSLAAPASEVADVLFEHEGASTVQTTLAGNTEFVGRVVLRPEDVRSAALTTLPVDAHVALLDASTSTVVKAISLRRDLVWIPTEAHVLGLDIGTSGARMVLDRGSTGEDLPFPLSAVDPRDREEADEFPALCLIDADGSVSRVGAGVMAARPLSATVIDSPKGRLLAAQREIDVERASAWFEAYVGAMGRSWNAVRKARDLGSVRMVVTVPHAYGHARTRWYCKLLESRFEGAVLVASVREAEAAAYFHLLKRLVTFEDTRRTLPTDRPLRTLVVDLGAGTTDFAFIDADTSTGRVSALRTRAESASPWAGDTYDEYMLAALFSADIAARLAADDGRLRQSARLFKQRELPRMLEDGRPIEYQDWGPASTASAEAFRASMEPFFARAITAPLEQLATEADATGQVVDQILLAGRGSMAFGCVERIRRDAAELFQPPAHVGEIPVAPFMTADSSHAIARGAVVFGRRGDVLIGDSDLRSGRHIYCLIHTTGGGREGPRPRRLYSRGDTIDPERRAPIRSAAAIEGAWVVGTRTIQTPRELDDVRGRLALSEALPFGVSILTAWRAEAETRALYVQVINDEEARFFRRDVGDEDP